MEKLVLWFVDHESRIHFITTPAEFGCGRIGQGNLPPKRKGRCASLQFACFKGYKTRGGNVTGREGRFWMLLAPNLRFSFVRRYPEEPTPVYLGYHPFGETPEKPIKSSI
jgi:hypothetical protein